MINRNVLLVSEDTIKETSILNDNAWGKYLLPSIQYAQESGLQAILGTCLYEKIIEMVADGTISLDVSAAYKELLDNYIQPYLVNKTLAETIVNVSAKVANIGSVISNDEHVSNLSQKDLELLRNTYVERSDFYEKRMQDFLKENRAAFQELNCPCGTLKPNLEASTNSVGVWLGGLRGRKISTSKCGCSESSSTPSGGDYDDGYRDGFVAGRASGITEGENIQRGKLVSTAITENGVYERYDGFKEVNVNVPTGSTIINQNKSVTITANTSTTVTYDGGYTGLGNVGINVNVPQTGHTDEEMQQMYQSGITYQKSLLTSLNVTQNGQYQREDGYSAITVNVSGQAPSLTTTAVTQNGEYSAPHGYDGFSSFEVNVPQTGHTDKELQDAYASGYTSGYSSGYTRGEGEGYSSGYSSGETHQKSLMVSTAITANTTVSRADGFSAVTVNIEVPFTGSSMMYKTEDNLMLMPNHITGFTSALIGNKYQDGNGTYYFENDLTVIPYECFQSSNLSEIIIPNTVRKIGFHSFTNCYYLKEIVIPNSVTGGTTEGEADGWFWSCTGLTSITLSNQIRKIGSITFAQLWSLEHFTVPSSVTDIVENGICDCTGLTAITFESVVPPTIVTLSTGGSEFLRNTNNCIIYVPSQSVDDYKTANVWKDVQNIGTRVQPIT